VEKGSYHYHKLAHAVDDAGRVHHGMETLNEAKLRYSSPRPWIVALGLSVALWAALACVLWTLFK
jgi:uncharacterized membrane protein YbhN (UPF0104 family)